MSNREAKLQIVVDAVNNAGSTFATLGANLDAVSAKTANLRSGMLAVGAAGTIAFAGLAALTGGVVKAGAQYEQTQISFRTMIGDAKLAQETLNDLAQFAAKTPFEIPEIENAGKQLLAYGFSTKELIPTLKNLGNVAAGLSIPMGDMAYLYGTLKTQGRAFSKDIYQFSARGIPILDELAKVLGVSKDQVMGMVEAGKVGFPEVEKAFQNMNSAGGQFNNLMEAQSGSLAGMWSNLKDKITLTARAIGVELLPYLKPVVDKLIEIATAVGEFVKQHPQLSAILLMLVLGFTGLLALLLPVGLALSAITVAWTAFSAITLAGVATFSLVIAILAALAFAIYNIVKIVDLLQNDWEDVWLGIKLIAADAANAVIGTVESMINFVINGVNMAIQAINKVITAAKSVPGIGKYLSNIGELSTVSLTRFDAGTITANDLAGRANPLSTPSTTVVVTGNTVLSQSVAEQIGDMILKGMKLTTTF